MDLITMSNEFDNEVRWDPTLREWVILAKNRSARPVLGKTFVGEEKKYQCPFCPDSPEGAGNWVVKCVTNRFPALIEDPKISYDSEVLIENFYKKRPGKGHCEVILYTQQHNSTFGDLTVSNLEALIDLWKERFLSNMSNKELRYSFIFENRGEIIGVSIAHPHGQIYSFPFIPPKIEKEVSSSKEYMEKEKKCLFCKILEVEMQNKSRIVEENVDFIAFIPYYAKWPFEIHIYPKAHYAYISDIPKKENTNFAMILKRVVKRLDGLFGFTMPYVMAHHNAPYNCGKTNFFHYHIEIYPPYRAKDRVKFLAGVELGTNTVINNVEPAENAKVLRDLKLDI
jgi:UDPglucose--hexose-1-phosphate uridylyltransferase